MVFNEITNNMLQKTVDQGRYKLPSILQNGIGDETFHNHAKKIFF